MTNKSEQPRCGFATLIGAPNAGKSTLTNHLVGTKVSIVTHKVQTTRARLRGILMEGDVQVVLVDTPGIFVPRRRLDRAMVDAAWSGAREGDVILCMVDVERGLSADVERILKGMNDLDGLKALVLNKIDKTGKDTLLALTKQISELVTFDETFMVSALRGHGVNDLKNWLVEKMPVGPWHFPEDQLVDAPMMLTAAEITREKIYLRLHQELPYASTVETTEWKNLDNGSVRIEQTIFVERDSQKMIVLGKGGRSIKAISQESRHELAEILDMPVHLFLFVKVRENWGDDPERYRGIGLDFPKE
ncbi:MAG: GTPase Era [bacterium]|nr:GTPase Era [bacterium]